MQGLWSAHRKTKVNLNAQTPPDITTPPSESSLNRQVERLGDADIQAGPSAQDASLRQTDGAKRKPRSTRGNDLPNKRQKATSVISSIKDHPPPSTRLSDLGGVQPCIEKMLELVAMPLCHPEVYLHTGVQPPRGVLLHGPPGCGKTLLANAIAGEIGVPFISISAPTIVSGMSGESEKTLRETFEEAKRIAPCLLFIDEVDAITPKRESAQREMERRIVAQFLTCMDDLSWDKTENKPVMVIGATNRPDSLDAALRRAGRFDHEITMGVPDEAAREQILRVQASKLRLAGDFDLRALAKATPGYVGADLAALTGAAGVIAVKRIFKGLAEGSIVLPPPGQDDMTVEPSQTFMPAPFTNMHANILPPRSIGHFLRAHPDPLTVAQLAPLEITPEDFQLALSEVQPSSKREGFATVPDVTWSDIGALQQIREELNMAIIQPLRRPELFSAVGVNAPCGVLLWGPPGCGKTLLAKAVANQSRANFISVKGPELLNKYVGESERAVRQVFMRARASSPCIIFFDELDALVPRRDDSLSEASSRVVNTLLTELDGLESRGSSVYIIGATNRPDMIDPAMCRPGRLDKLLYVDLPNADERVEILRTLVGAKKKGQQANKPVPVHGGFDGPTFKEVEALVRGERAEGYSGADLASFVREAAIGALRFRIGSLQEEDEEHAAMFDNDTVEVALEHFVQALDKVTPSVSAFQRRRYDALRSKLAGMPVGGSNSVPRSVPQEPQGTGDTSTVIS